ncbi:hypothetical protein KAS14_07295 [Candidatus Bathyarchaeota archaeon]|nr:hypothetical protein [Candidatus Bathyarchaeota archaeon]
MKYIVFWEFKPEDLDKLIELDRQHEGNRKKFPNKYSKVLFPSHGMSGETKGFTIVETTPEKIINSTLFFMPVMKLKYVPIIESAKIMEQYLKSK